MRDFSFLSHTHAGGDKRGAMPAWLAVVVVLVVAFLAWLVWMIVGGQDRLVQQAPGGGRAPDVSSRAAEKVQAFSGEVVQVQDGVLVVQALPAQNPFLSSPQEYIVSVDENTAWVLTLPAHPSSGSLVQRREASQGDVQVGDQVTVRVAGDARTSTRLRAVRIEIVR